MKEWTADPLIWGHGPSELEAFLEPTCPFSGLAFGKLFELLERVGHYKLTVKIRLQSQSWHLFSGIITRTILAASTLPEGKEQARKLMAAIYAKREDFEFENHCSGPNLDVTPRALIARMEQVSGLDLADAFAIPGLDREMKWHARYARQNGIHVSPTFMVDGLVKAELGSRDPLEIWAAALGLTL